MSKLPVSQTLQVFHLTYKSFFDWGYNYSEVKCLAEHRGAKVSSKEPLHILSVKKCKNC